jgi:hypothetical protein
MSGISGANPYLARTLTEDLVQQAKAARENEANAELARLDEADLREIEREPQSQAAVTLGRPRSLLDRLRR